MILSSSFYDANTDRHRVEGENSDYGLGSCVVLWFESHPNVMDSSANFLFFMSAVVF